MHKSNALWKWYSGASVIDTQNAEAGERKEHSSVQICKN